MTIDLLYRLLDISTYRKIKKAVCKAINFKTPFGTFNSSERFFRNGFKGKVRSEIGSH